MDAELKKKLIIGAVGLAVAGGAYVMLSRASAAAPADGGGAASPGVMFVPSGSSPSIDTSGISGGGTGLVDTAANTGATFAAPLTDLSQSPIPVYPLSSDAVMASQSVAQSSISSALTSHLSDNATQLLSQVLAAFGSGNGVPQSFNGELTTINGNTNFHYDATRFELPFTDVALVPPTPVAVAPAGPAAQETLSSNDIALINTFASNSASTGIRSLDYVVSRLTSPGVMTLPAQYRDPAALKNFIANEPYYTTYLNQFLS